MAPDDRPIRPQAGPRAVPESRPAEHALRFIAQAGELLSSSLDVEATLTTLTGLLVPALADWCIVDMLEPDGTIRQLAVAHRDPERMDLIRELRRRFPPDWSQPHPITRVLATGQAEVATHITDRTYPLTQPDDPENQRILAALGLCSHIVAPLVAKGRTLGALSLISGESGRRYGQDDLELVEEVARRAGVAVENAQLYRDAQEAAWRESESRAVLDAVMRNAPVGLGLLDTDLRYLQLNESLAGMNGPTIAEHLGRSVREVIPEIADTIEPILRGVLATGRPVLEMEMRSPAAHDPATPRDWLLSYYPVARPDGSPIGVGVVLMEVTERRRAETAQRFLAMASEALSTSLDYEATFAEVARLAVPELADVCLVYVRGPGREIERVAAEYPGGEALTDRLREFRIDPDAREGIPAVLRSGEPVLVPEADAALLSADVERPNELAALIEPLGLRSWMCVPLSAGGDVIGAISFASAGRRYDAVDLELAVELARRAAVAVQNARLYLDAQESRDRLEILAEASAVLGSSLDYEHTLAAVARYAVPALADWCEVDVVSETGELQELAVAHADPEKVDLAREYLRRYPRDPNAPIGVPAVVRSGEPAITPVVTDEMLQAFAHDPEHLAMMRSLGIASVMILPLTARGRTLGALSLVSSDPARRFDQGDLGFATDLARRAAMAVDNARLFRERSRIAETLQRSLLPPALPSIPGFEVAARYHPATDATDVGGDFYDVFQTGDDRWAVVIGDVCGKGVDAAALTGLTRYTIRATARQRDDARYVLRALNDTVLAEEIEGRFCTVVYGSLRLEGDHAMVTATCAGHPLPILQRSADEIETVGAPGSLLGVMADPHLEERSVRVEPGDAVVLFTDGVVERRREGEEFGEAGLRRVLTENAGSSAPVLAEAIERTALDFGEGGPKDDLAVLVLKMVEPG